MDYIIVIIPMSGLLSKTCLWYDEEVSEATGLS